MPQRVLLIHGINSDGEWHDEVRKVLEPHFECVPVKYRDYRVLGAPKIYFWPWAFWLAAVLGMCATGFYTTLVLRVALVWTIVGVVIAERALRGFFGWQLIPVTLGMIGYGVGLEVGAPWQDVLLWLCVCGLAAYWELRVSIVGHPSLARRFALALSMIWGFVLLVAFIVWELVQVRPATGGLGIPGLLLLFGVIEPRIRQSRVAYKVQEAVGRAGAGRTPHLIAHSFGTLLTGVALKTFPGIQLDRVILLGSVLDERFPWDEVLRPARSAAAFVRNEQGKQDQVVKAAGVARAVLNRLASIRARIPGVSTLERWFRYWVPLRDMPGMSGVVGFHGDCNMIHTVEGDFAPCKNCPVSGPRARVHNVILRKFRHSTFGVNELHARRLWLPFLWGFAASEYRDFLNWCEDGADYKDQANYVWLGATEHQMTTTTWNWPLPLAPDTMPPGGRTLDQYTRDALPYVLREHGIDDSDASVDQFAEQLRKRIPADLFTIVRDAINAIHNSALPRRRDLLLSLNPTHAISCAVKQALL